MTAVGRGGFTPCNAYLYRWAQHHSIAEQHIWLCRYAAIAIKAYAGLLAPLLEVVPFMCSAGD